MSGPPVRRVQRIIRHQRAVGPLDHVLERLPIESVGNGGTGFCACAMPLGELEVADGDAVESESPTLHAAEREHILRVLRETKGQIGGADGAAERLGLKRTTLNSKLKKLGIERSDYM